MNVVVTELAKQIRSRVLEYIDQEKLSEGDLAQKLDLLPSGVKVLFLKTDWDLASAVIVAHKLGFSVSVELDR